MYNFLVADNSKTVLDVIEFSFEKFDYKVFTTSQINEIWDILKNNKIDVVLLNEEIENSSGIEIAKAIMSSYNSILLIMSYSQQLDKKLKAREIGVDGWIIKPFIPERLVRIIVKTFFE